MSAAILTRARALIGIRFRPNGRDPAHGLDCVGVAAVAFGLRAEAGFAMRGGDVARVGAVISRHGLVPVAGEGRAGDLILMRAGPGQLHLGIRSERGIIHADARLRRVVELPGVPPWPVIGGWRAKSLPSPAGEGLQVREKANGNAGADDGGQRDRWPDRGCDRGDPGAAGR